jgi:hypothetical protein
MGGNENDGYYCTICGGIPPDKITTKRVLIDGKETGIDHLDWIFGEVAKLTVDNDAAITEEILKRVKQFNYVPTKKTKEYGAGLLAAYKNSGKRARNFFYQACQRLTKKSRKITVTSLFNVRAHFRLLTG